MWWALARVWWKPALALFVVLGVYLYIQYLEQDNAELANQVQDSVQYEETTKRVNNAVKKSERLDLGDARDWLRKYADR